MVVIRFHVPIAVKTDPRSYSSKKLKLKLKNKTKQQQSDREKGPLSDTSKPVSLSYSWKTAPLCNIGEKQTRVPIVAKRRLFSYSCKTARIPIGRNRPHFPIAVKRRRSPVLVKGTRVPIVVQWPA